MILNGEMQNRLEQIIDDYRKTRPAALQGVLVEVLEAVKSGELVDAYQARYVRDALYSTEELKEKNSDIVAEIESNFF